MNDDGSGFSTVRWPTTAPKQKRRHPHGAAFFHGHYQGLLTLPGFSRIATA
ncbi:MAG: hypothetical protein ACK4FZ_15890 [Vogesella sp.]|jgi:hypothetical protein|uniref:hypothetical protein n=1 Tax=Vogesella sp. TaxID=1904252 RepID=UPI00391A7279